MSSSQRHLLGEIKPLLKLLLHDGNIYFRHPNDLVRVVSVSARLSRLLEKAMAMGYMEVKPGHKTCYFLHHLTKEEREFIECFLKEGEKT